jgi:hypothetical protein
MSKSFDNTKRGNFHILEIEKSEKYPFKYAGKPFPISLLDTHKLKINESQVLIEEGGLYYDVLHTNSKLTVQSADGDEVGKVKTGTPAVVGANMNVKQSPAPLCYIDSDGTLNSVVLADSIWSESVMGWTAEGKPNTYSQGFVPEGDSDHQSLFLRKDGQWGQPSVHSGSVSEHFLSLGDTPLTYNNQLNKYLRVSYEEGGSVVFDDIDTSKVPENTNLYYTDDRVHTEIVSKCSDRSIPELNIQNTITCNELLTDSNRALKENFQRLKPSESLNRVMKIKSYCYNFKGNKKIRAGFIADEVQKIIPTIATPKSINYLELIPYLVGSIQKLNNEVEMLKNNLEKKS